SGRGTVPNAHPISHSLTAQKFCQITFADSHVGETTRVAPPRRNVEIVTATYSGGLTLACT
ncbi:MAG: hypothetical protein WBE08_14310, partial [Methyloceanibacter sp.]